MIADWPEASRSVAMTTMEQYGPPDEVTATLLRWRNNGPWKRTTIWREDRFDELAAYDGSVIAERTKGEISARCDVEGANFLAINLANDVATGKRTVEEARRFYADTIVAMKRGEKPAYTQRFVFDVPRRNVGDPDEAVIEPGALGATR